ncbi:signal recognition particle SEC65 subunit [Diplogelasinospora grovesii]|uniref:Signal recognition particle SEC65 subunit n=1 Tax=Diplogelasinospora grovesii TaxID=303347 RepID=A0AAN6S919_9PEZI|nr:signal recognition particle SEC65 subunit [Diplogelasinospora grovesii]
MPSHPRVEEVSDSDSSEGDMSDPSEGDIDDFVESDILQQRKPAPPKPPQPQPNRTAPPPSYPAGGRQPPAYAQMPSTTDESLYKSFSCLYPVYFDATRSRAEGRRVCRSLAVKSPLATEIVQACASLGLQTVFEAGKLHPKDWANPGRVKISLGGSGQTQTHPVVKNKHHLYILVAKHLKANPTTENSPALRVRIANAPPPPTTAEKGGWPKPAVPRGWKVGELLPYYSPAMTGGGVSENFLKDMMKEMQAGGGGGMPGAGGGGPPMDMASLMAAAAGQMGGGGGGSGGSEGGGGGRKKDKKGKGKG